MIVMLYAPIGSELISTTVDGVLKPPSGHHDNEYPVDLRVVRIPAGQKVSLTFDLVAPLAGDKDLEAQVTPMVKPTQIALQPLDCATVPTP
jgi:hypothetical protein